MSLLQSSNPVLTSDVFQQRVDGLSGPASRAGLMTYGGTVATTGILLGLTLASAVASWALLIDGVLGGTFPIIPVAIGTSLGAFVLGLVIFFKPNTAPVLAPIYALAEGFVVAMLSLLYASFAGEIDPARGATLPGDSIIFQAVLLTVGITGMMLIAYSTRVIRATPMFVKGVIAATGGVIFLMLATMLLRLFGVHMPWLWDGGPISLGIAGVIVVIAALNLVLDFKLIEDGVNSGMPKKMEWFAGFALLVTLIWLYLSILRLLALINRE